MNSNNNLCLILALMLLATGCTSPSLRLYSVETKNLEGSSSSNARRVALLPPAGRLAFQQHVRPMNAGMETFIQYAESSDVLVTSPELEKILSDQPRLNQAYQTLLNELVDFDRTLYREKSDTPFTMNPAPWSGDRGIKYDRVQAICESQRYQWTIHGPIPRNEQTNAAMVPANLSLNWQLIQKPASERVIPAKAAQELSAAFGCDELLIPIVRDTCFFVKKWHVILFVPIFRSSFVAPHQEIALYLVDGQSGRIIRSIQTLEPDNGLYYTGGALAMAVSLDRILDQTSALGAFEFEK
ncbi:MAG TPA: hypothetical protein DCZ95_11930 [Verrucomicrobia bacterium]|nr:MAG: hypothetical protein A2X46_13975 [Lentisphaerae bacterium GWF2_57_35]HBA84794.1 hypothetical protein [Verrucomicrobiota bacterium]